MSKITFEEHLNEVKKGNRKSLIKALNAIESLDDETLHELLDIYLKAKKHPPIIGLVGTPGAGKSTFLNSVLSLMTKDEELINKKVALLLIDPADVTTKGALLGDRIRLSEFYLHKNFVIRSISNKGDTTGLSPFIIDYLLLLSLYSFDYIFVETVGGGQSQTDLCQIVDWSYLIYDPNSGDGIQHLKSGVLDSVNEIIISKADIVETKHIAHSLQDWIKNHVEINALNLLDQKSIYTKLKSSITLASKQKSKGLISFYLKNQLEKRFKKQVSDFIQNQDLSSIKTKKNAQELIENFFKNFE